MSTDTFLDFVRPDYLGIDPHITADRKAYLRSVWHALSPELELQYGVYNSTVAAPAAIFSQAVIDSINLWRRHTQIAQLVEDIRESPEIHYPCLEMFLANYRVKRKVGTNSVGLVRLLFNTNTSYSFGVTETFTAKGLMFSPTAQFGISPTGRIAYAQNNQVLQRLDDGNFAAVIELASETISPAANLPVGTQLVMTRDVYPSLLEATVIESFVGGIEEDTLITLVPQLINGITSPVMTSRANISAQLKTLPNINIFDISVIGAGDVESVRDKHGLFPISQGGRGDIYIKTSNTIQTTTIVKTCELVETIDANNARYRCLLSREDAPAAYTVTSVRGETSSKNLDVVHETRGVDLTGLTYAPDVVNYVEGAFSMFQTIMLEFVDNEMGRFGSTAEFPVRADYTIGYDYLPNIVEIQRHCINRSNVSMMGDLLVKAAIPCKVSIGFSVVVQQGQTPPDINTLAATAMSAVTNTGFMNVLPASVIIEAVQKQLPTGMFVSDFSMSGDLLLPVLHEGEGAITVLRRTAEADKEELMFDVPP